MGKSIGSFAQQSALDRSSTVTRQAGSHPTRAGEPWWGSVWGLPSPALHVPSPPGCSPFPGLAANTVPDRTADGFIGEGDEVSCFQMGLFEFLALSLSKAVWGFSSFSSPPPLKWGAHDAGKGGKLPVPINLPLR